MCWSVGLRSKRTYAIYGLPIALWIKQLIQISAYPRTRLKMTSLASCTSRFCLGGTHLVLLGELQDTTATGCWEAGLRSGDGRTSPGPWKSRDFAPRPSTFVFSCHNRGNTTRTYGRNRGTPLKTHNTITNERQWTCYETSSVKKDTLKILPKSFKL